MTRYEPHDQFLARIAVTHRRMLAKVRAGHVSRADLDDQVLRGVLSPRRYKRLVTEVPAGIDADLLDAIRDCHGIAWDGCHKIYVLQGEDTFRDMLRFGYGDGSDGSELITVGRSATAHLAAARTVADWYGRSCSLRFITAIRAGDEPGGDDVYSRIVEQFDDWPGAELRAAELAGAAR